MQRRRLKAAALVVPVVAALGLGNTAGATSLAAIPCDVTALNNAIDAANNNTGPHTIRLAPKCVYNVLTPASTGGLGPNALPRITGTVTLLGDKTTIRRDPDATEGFRIAEVDGPDGRLTIEGVTATGGGYLDYAGTYLPRSGGTLILKHSTVTNSTANVGGAIVVDLSSTLEIHDSVVRDSAAQRGGAIYNGPGSTTLLQKTKVVRNQATELGGGIFTAGVSLTIKNSHIEGNRAFQQGGGIYNDRAPMDISSTTIADNRAGQTGGGIANDGTTTLTDTKVRRNIALNGGGVWQGPSGGSLTLVRSRIVENTPNNCRPVGAIPGCTN
ncbi:right-handed parallel beta-helix repeat-containing protein [Streptomyces sp. NPDC001584]|uniref:right-handed parallel beta-helix repeat-containing protein n=1 Tax=Streptomyces sp. NPDC001584 TaxID=3154521 RepID=UPI00332ADB96